MYRLTSNEEIQYILAKAWQGYCEQGQVFALASFDNFDASNMGQVLRAVKNGTNLNVGELAYTECNRDFIG